MILGITGTNGAGKGTVVQYLMDRNGFKHLSVRAFLQKKMQEAGVPVDRDHMINFANNLRKENGADYLFKELYKEAQAMGGDVVIESIRTVAEVKALKSHPDSYLLAVDADQTLRFERVHGRTSALDEVTFEEFKDQEEREMYNDDPGKQNLRAVMELADRVIHNDNHTELLYKAVDDFLQEVESS